MNNNLNNADQEHEPNDIFSEDTHPERMAKMHALLGQLPFTSYGKNQPSRQTQIQTRKEHERYLEELSLESVDEIKAKHAEERQRVRKILSLRKYPNLAAALPPNPEGATAKHHSLHEFGLK